MATRSPRATRRRRRFGSRTSTAEPEPGMEESGAPGQQAGDAQYGQTLRLTVPGDAEHVWTVRRTACEFASHHRVERLEDVALAIGEASANVALHAYVGRTPGPLHLTGFVDDELDLVCLVVADEGSGLAPRLDSPGLGLGLPIIARASDRVEITERPDTGTVLTMGFAHTPPPELLERERFEQARRDISGAIREGCCLETVEQRIARAPVSGDARDALWLSAWATFGREHQQQAPPARGTSSR